jgi:hypothetical protein
MLSFTLPPCQTEESHKILGYVFHMGQAFAGGNLLGLAEEAGRALIDRSSISANLSVLFCLTCLWQKMEIAVPEIRKNIYAVPD